MNREKARGEDMINEYREDGERGHDQSVEKTGREDIISEQRVDGEEGHN